MPDESEEMGAVSCVNSAPSLSYTHELGAGMKVVIQFVGNETRR